jgi:4-carboxymuconolactone decarboxylase
MNPGGLLCVLAAAAARGHAGRTRDAAVVALASGVDPALLRAALRMIHPFVGFPRALDAWIAVSPVLPGAGEPAPEVPNAEVAGRAVFDAVYGPDAEAILGRIAAMDAEAARRVIADAYGRVLSQGDLDLATRERIAVVLLAAQGLQNQIRGHVRGALRCGVSRADLESDLAACGDLVAAPDAAAVRAAIGRGVGGDGAGVNGTS